MAELDCQDSAGLEVRFSCDESVFDCSEHEAFGKDAGFFLGVLVDAGEDKLHFRFAVGPVDRCAGDEVGLFPFFESGDFDFGCVADVVELGDVASTFAGES